MYSLNVLKSKLQTLFNFSHNFQDILLEIIAETYRAIQGTSRVKTKQKS